MEKWGNGRANEMYEGNMPGHVCRPKDGDYLFIYFDRIVFDLLVLMPFWLVCILHMEHSFLVCVVNEFF
jgi:hypothetical protein